MADFKRTEPVRVSPWAHRELRVGLLFIAPWLFGFLTFTLYPLLSSVYYSFTAYDIVQAPRWVGFDNYLTLGQDRLFAAALRNTGLYIALAVPSSLIVAYALALLLHQPLFGRRLLRTCFYVPSVVPAVSSALLWLWILDGQSGLVNGSLNALGLPSAPWLAHPDWAMPSLILINLWFTGNALVVFLAALQSVPHELYEAIQLDGASPWRRVWSIAIPMTSPAIFFNLITGVIGASQLFTFPYILTEGGPANATLTFALYLYRVAFTYLRMGYASAMAWISFVLVAGVVYLIFRSAQPWVFYSSD